MTRSITHLAAEAFGISGWMLFTARSADAIRSYAMGPEVDSVYLYDWRVYYAGAVDLLERDLYLDGGIGIGGRQMPVDVFNLPPGSAAVALPWVPLGYQTGGLLWIIAGAIALLVAGLWARRLLRIRHGTTILGVLMFLYAVQPFFVRVTVLGNVNALMMPLLVAFVWAHLAGRDRIAGVLLGLAVAVKIWPIALTVLLVRERRWLALIWSLALLAVQGGLALIWLGMDAVIPMIDALQTRVPIPAGVDVLWTSWAREALYWWPAWGSVAVAVLLVAIPARGRLGIGLGMVAGLSLIANIWDHYLPIFALAFLLIGSSPELGRLVRQLSAALRPPVALPSVDTSR